MAVRLQHPAWNNKKIATDYNMGLDRRPTWGDIKEQQRLKKLKKKRKRG